MKQLIALILLFSVANSNAQNTLRTLNFNIEKGIAIAGYDPVSYFIEGKATLGNKANMYIIEGVTYYFINSKNKATFIKEPKKFEPQYGGWCAYAMGSTGEKVEIDPETFKINNGKLYLFYHSWVNNTKTKWDANELPLKLKADKNWTLIFK